MLNGVVRQGQATFRGNSRRRAPPTCWLTHRMTSQFEKTEASCSLVSACLEGEGEGEGSILSTREAGCTAGC